MRGWRGHWKDEAAKSQQSHSAVNETVILSGRRMEGYETGVLYLNRVYRHLSSSLAASFNFLFKLKACSSACSEPYLGIQEAQSGQFAPVNIFNLKKKLNNGRRPRDYHA